MLPELPSPGTFSAEALTLHRFLLRFSHSLVLAFLWVFIYLYFLMEGLTLGDALAHALFLYALSEVVTILSMPLALRYIGKSMLRGVVFGTVALALAYVYAGALSIGIFPHGAAIIGILLGLYRALYRVPYAMERNALSSGRFPAGEFVLAMLPALAGILLSTGMPFVILMFVAGIVAVMALAPLVAVPTVSENFSWGYRETFQRCLHEGNAYLVYRSVVSGVMGASLVVLWPLILFFMGIPSPAILGSLVSATLLVSLFFRKRGIFLILEQHADGGTYIDEYTAIKEMSSAFGRVLICVAIGALAALF